MVWERGSQLSHRSKSGQFLRERGREERREGGREGGSKLGREGGWVGRRERNKREAADVNGGHQLGYASRCMSS